MALTPGTRLGVYEVTAQIGEGGMGQVYRARDTKLNRDVALKILPDAFADNPDRLARFSREAQVLASLNHPNIAHIYGLEDTDGVKALVLELVEGEDLAQRIARGAIPVDEALPIARQIADALEAAHAQAIIHRDLKPANIKLRPDGTVKVLDFGLAKALEPASVSDNVSQSPTITSPAMTRMGVILGTAAYMSPEQAKGRPVDKRSDIWAFGCVLFEMLTGNRVFSGEEVSDTLAVILTKEPDWTLLPPATPPSIRRVLRRCLEKDRTQRLADVADARLELDERVTESATSGAAPPPQATTIRRWLPWSVAAACLATTLWLAGLMVLNQPAAGTEMYRSSILLPGQLGLLGPSVALSPDGRRVAFVASDSTGHSQLWIRALDGLAAQPLADTAAAYSPFWSPDSRWLAFVQNGKLKKIEASGGQVVTLCDSARLGGTWNRDDVILFGGGAGLAQVRAEGGTPSPITTVDANRAEAHVSPFFLPDGRHFVYVAMTFSGHAEVYLASLDAAAQPTPLHLDATGVQYASGFLWFLRGSTLMAQPFDASRRTLAGEAVPIAEQVRIDTTFLRSGVFSLSATGALVYQTDPSPGNELVWYDRDGRPTGTLGTRADYADLQLSPDGRRVLVSVAATGAPNPSLWIFDVARGLRTRFTLDDMRPIGGAIWSPDGGRIVFASQRKGQVALFQKASSGAGGEEVLLEDEFEKELHSWSPDGRFILYSKRSGGARSPWVLPLGGDRKPFVLAYPRAFFSQFSFDGRWILYGSSESGRSEVYVAPFPGPGGQSLISIAGGRDPRWRADGKEIFYLGPNNKLMSAAVTLDRDRVEVGEVKPLFELRKVGPRFTYDVSPDGKRILAVTQPAQTTSVPLTLIVNWPALLKK